MILAPSFGDGVKQERKGCNGVQLEQAFETKKLAVLLDGVDTADFLHDSDLDGVRFVH